MAASNDYATATYEVTSLIHGNDYMIDFIKTQSEWKTRSNITRVLNRPTKLKDVLISLQEHKILKLCLFRFFAIIMFTKCVSNGLLIFSTIILLQLAISVTSSHIDEDLKLSFEEKHALMQVSIKY